VVRLPRTWLLGGFFDASGAFIYASENISFRTTDMPKQRSSWCIFCCFNPAPLLRFPEMLSGTFMLPSPLSEHCVQVRSNRTSAVFAGTGMPLFGRRGNRGLCKHQQPDRCFRRRVRQRIYSRPIEPSDRQGRSCWHDQPLLPAPVKPVCRRWSDGHFDR